MCEILESSDGHILRASRTLPELESELEALGYTLGLPAAGEGYLFLILGDKSVQLGWDELDKLLVSDMPIVEWLPHITI